MSFGEQERYKFDSRVTSTTDSARRTINVMVEVERQSYHSMLLYNILTKTLATYFRNYQTGLFSSFSCLICICNC